MTLHEFQKVAKASKGKIITFFYNDKRRTGELTEAIGLPNSKFRPFGYISINDVNDGYRRFDVRKMFDIEFV